RRRSEWPMIAWVAPVSLIMAALTSPVNAPSRSKWRFCAAMPIGRLRVTSPATASDVKGGAATISAPHPPVGRPPRRRDDDPDARRRLGQRPEFAQVRERLEARLVHLPIRG